MMQWILPADTLTGGSAGRMIFNVLTTLIVFVVILYLAYMASKLVGKRYGGMSTQKNIKVLDMQTLAPNKSLVIVQTGGKTMLLGVTKEQITCLTELDADALTLQAGTAAEPLDFAKALKTAVSQRFKGGKPPADTTVQEQEDTDESE